MTRILLELIRPLANHNLQLLTKNLVNLNSGNFRVWFVHISPHLSQLNHIFFFFFQLLLGSWIFLSLYQEITYKYRAREIIPRTVPVASLFSCKHLFRSWTCRKGDYFEARLRPCGCLEHLRDATHMYVLRPTEHLLTTWSRHHCLSIRNLGASARSQSTR